MSGESGIAVNKLKLECQVAAGTTAGGSLARRLEKIARTQLSDALQDCLQPLDGGGDEIVLIKQLQLDFDLDLLLSEQDIARLWAGKIKTALLHSLHSNSASGRLVFASPAHYLSAALMDMRRGRAQQLWYYRHFNGLWSLPLSAALRTALLDDPQQGVAALALLQQAERLELCDGFSAADAERLLDGLFASPQVSVLSIAAARAFAATVADSYQLASNLHGRQAQQVLLLATLALGKPATPNLSLLPACARCFSLLMDLQQQHAEHFAAMVEALADNRPAQLRRWLSPTRLARLTELLHGEAGALQYLAQPLLAVKPPRPEIVGDELQHSFTGFGNALLLLPQIYRLPLHTVSQWSPLSNQSGLSLLRWLVLCACQGADRFYAALQDPLLRELCGVAAGISMAELAAWLNRQLTAERCAELYAQLKQQLAGGDSLQCYQWQWRDRRVTLHGETRKACWISLRIEPDEEPLAVIPAPHQDDSQNRVKEDFDSLWLKQDYGLDDPSRACLVTLAQITLKSFAFRLPGFAGSSVSYLLQNFLSMSATLVAEEQHINAWLSRVPMSIMLNMTGISRDVIQLPDFDTRPIRLLESG